VAAYCQIEEGETRKRREPSSRPKNIVTSEMDEFLWINALCIHAPRRRNYMPPGLVGEVSPYLAACNATTHLFFWIGLWKEPRTPYLTQKNWGRTDHSGNS
jgi:hypothetical protein